MIRKRYTPAQKAAIVLELFKEEETLPQIAECVKGFWTPVVKRFASVARPCHTPLSRPARAG